MHGYSSVTPVYNDAKRVGIVTELKIDTAHC